VRTRAGNNSHEAIVSPTIRRIPKPFWRHRTNRRPAWTDRCVGL